MLVKFFNRGRGGGNGPADYLMGKNRDREHAQVIRGDLEQTVELINGLNFARNYTCGCLSFAESDITSNQKADIMNTFEDMVFAGLDHDQFNITWVEHKDKGRLELNFLIPNVELQSGKRYQPYYHRAERKMMNAFQHFVNAHYQFKDPHDPRNKSALTLPRDLPKNKEQVHKVITSGLVSMAESGLVKDRTDVIQALQESGFEIAREAKSFISIKHPDGGRNIRLKGALYAKNFRAGTELRARIEKAGQEYENNRERRIEAAGRIYAFGNRRKRARNEARYARVESAPPKPVQENKMGAIERIIADRLSKRNGSPSELGRLTNTERDGREVFLEQKITEDLNNNDRSRATIAAITQSATIRLRNAIQRTARVLEQLSEQHQNEAAKTHQRVASRAREREDVPTMQAW